MSQQQTETKGKTGIFQNFVLGNSSQKLKISYRGVVGVIEN